MRYLRKTNVQAHDQSKLKELEVYSSKTEPIKTKDKIKSKRKDDIKN